MSATPTWRMPAEWAPHERTWMAWPSAGYTLGESEAEVETARRTWAAVARAVATYEPVTLVATPADADLARGYVTEAGPARFAIDVVTAALDDAWMRDIGPTFVLGKGGRLGAVTWVFNGWGGQEWASWEHDAQIATFVGEQAGATIIDSPLVNEGGGLHVDGEGAVLLTETVQLDPGRNPGATHADVEGELARTIGATTAIWLPRGLTRDYDEFGTRGHVDIVACFSEPGTVLLHWQEDPDHPDYAVSREAEEVLRTARDASGRALTVVKVAAPQTLTDDGGPVDWSYINHLVCNGGVVACAFDDPNDERAVQTLRGAYPGRQVTSVDARPLFDRGGGIHCITQQQPLRPLL